MRVQAGGGAHVYPLDRDARQTEERLRDLALGSGQREHRAVVVRIAVQVEKAGRPQAPLEGLQQRVIATLADVGDGEEKGMLGHGREG